MVRCVDSAWAASLAEDVMLFGTWALVGPVDVVRGALSRGGAGFWVFGGGICAQRAAVAVEAASRVVRGSLEVIFNTTSAAEAKARRRR